MGQMYERTWTYLKTCGLILMVSFDRLAACCSGAHGSLSGLLLGFLLGVSGPVVHHVKGGTFLLHWAVSGLCRYHIYFLIIEKDLK